jgi:phytanoyl-CoA hydroxylase
MKVLNIQQHYRENGFCIVENVIDSSLIEEARLHIAWLMGKHPETPPEDLNYWLINGDPFWYRLISDERLLNVAEVILGKNIAHYGSHYFAKPPRTGKAILWHQDGAYQGLTPSDSELTIWLALDNVTSENGCLQVIPRSHTLTLEPMVKTSKNYTLLEEAMNQNEINESHAVELLLKPGDVALIHPHTIHSSNPNQSNQWRRALAIRYIPTSTTIQDEDCNCAYLLRGAADPNVCNIYQNTPVYIEGRHMPFLDAHHFYETSK